ncbi:SIR2 family protein [Klebsiella quasipneumoniae]|nr:SIR2 family protein [Klebsiella quasipneumoniae]
MFSKMDVTKLSLPKVNIDEMFRRINSGKAIIFTGAGFSRNAKNIANVEPPLAKELSKKIGALAGLGDDNEDLMFTSHFYLKHGNKNELLKLLKDNFVLREVSESHQKICSLPWRRFYTTNYDNSIELASLLVGKRIESLDIDDLPKDYLSQGDLCVHLNGVIDKATIADLDSKIKLTNSSYLSPQSFLSSQWNYVFKRDLETASAVIFVGYSMYDMDVQRLLYQTDSLVEKTYFIVHDNASFQETFFLTDFGHVLTVGVDGFAKIINDMPVPESEDTKDLSLDCFEFKEIDYNHETITDTEIKDFLLFGKHDDNQINTSVSNDFVDNFLINRELLNDTIKLIQSRNNVLIHSELGNGKTIFLKMITYLLSREGYNVYTFCERSEYDDELSEVD